MARELFIYWKIEQARAEGAIHAVGRFQADLQQAHPQLQVKLYRRSDIRDGMVTLMETYAHPGGVSAGMQASIDASARVQLAAWCPGPRNAEVFDSI